MSIPSYIPSRSGVSVETRLESRTAEGSVPGRIVYIGVGVGNPELLTLAGLRALSEADKIVLDREEFAEILAHPGVLTHSKAVRVVLDKEDDLDARVNKAFYDASAGLHVVRVVEGDTLLNRECRIEAASCVQKGIPVDVLPGVSPLTALPTYAGAGSPAADSGQFIVAGKQGVSVIPAQGSVFILCDSTQLVDIITVATTSGRGPQEKVLLTLKPATNKQRSITTQLDKLAAVAIQECSAENPEMVSLIIAPEDDVMVDWYESKSLFGWRVLIPQTSDNVQAMERLFIEHGASTHLVPTISVEPPRNPQQMEKAITGLVDGRYEWVVFTSGHAVRAVLDKLKAYGLDARAFSGLRVAAVGPVTAKYLLEWGITPDFIPERHHSGAGLAAEFPVYDDQLDPINRVLIPRADIATESLCTSLTQLGWEVEEVTAYRTVRVPPPPPEVREAIKTGKFDAVVFTSSSTVRNLIGIAGKPPPQTIVAAIGPATAETCVEHGLRVDVTADRPEHARLVESLVAFAMQRRASLLAEGERVVPPSQRKRRRSR